MKWFYIGLGVVILVSIYDSGSGDLDIKLRNMLHFPTLPKEYEKYKSIDSDTVFHFGNKVMTLKFTSDNIIETYLNPNDELIVITEKQQRNNQPDLYNFILTTFKLDKNGNIIDQFQYVYSKSQYNNKEILFEGCEWISKSSFIK